MMLPHTTKPGNCLLCPDSKQACPHSATHPHARDSPSMRRALHAHMHTCIMIGTRACLNTQVCTYACTRARPPQRRSSQLLHHSRSTPQRAISSRMGGSNSSTILVMGSSPVPDASPKPPSSTPPQVTMPHASEMQACKHASMQVTMPQAAAGPAQPQAGAPAAANAGWQVNVRLCMCIMHAMCARVCVCMHVHVCKCVYPSCVCTLLQCLCTLRCLCAYVHLDACQLHGAEIPA